MQHMFQSLQVLKRKDLRFLAQFYLLALSLEITASMCHSIHAEMVTKKRACVSQIETDLRVAFFSLFPFYTLQIDLLILVYCAKIISMPYFSWCLLSNRSDHLQSLAAAMCNCSSRHQSAVRQLFYLFQGCCAVLVHFITSMHWIINFIACATPYRASIMYFSALLCYPSCCLYLYSAKIR